MRHAPHPTGRRLVSSLLLAISLGACAYAIPEVDPADIPRIQQDLSTDPENTGLQVQLGMAHFKAGDFDASLASLQAAVDAGNESGPALLYLGMVQEEFENWSAAREAYNQYLVVGRSEPLKENIRGRLEIIGQNVLRQEARAALAREAEIADTDVTPRSVAVFPFAFNSDREELEPLIYALSDMMITDFGVSNALTVLERGQIQTLLDEIGLTESGYAEAGTGARAGRLLGAEHVVQGVLTTLGDDELQVATDVLNVPGQRSAGQPSASGALQELFDIEKDLVFRTIREVLGVELTPAEEQAIRDNRTDNVLAFLAYGRGLRERDRGNYQAASQQFQQAQQLDPNFQPAQQAATQSSSMEAAASVSTTQVAATAAATGETARTSTVAPPPSAAAATTATSTTTAAASSAATQQTLSGASEAVNPTATATALGTTTTQASTPAPQQQQQKSEKRSDAVQESQGQAGVTSTATAQIRIVIKRPGGEP